MNFLAHAFLSGDDDEIILGGFIADHVKGNDKLNYSEKIILGIDLHRNIDSFTDSHPEVEKSKERLRPHFHKYSPVVIDVFYDHFLAKNWNRYSSENFQEYVQSFYRLMELKKEIFPLRTLRMFHLMIQENWLESYKEIEGIHAALSNMARRTRFESNMEQAAAHLQKDYACFENEFFSFFPEVMEFSIQKRDSP
jgi:acyl carrier protein phosphodiesterase